MSNATPTTTTATQKPHPRYLPVWAQIPMGLVLCFFTFMAGFIMAIRGAGWFAFMGGGLLAGLMGPWTIIAGVFGFVACGIPGMGFPTFAWIIGGSLAMLLRLKPQKQNALIAVGAFLLVGAYANWAARSDEHKRALDFYVSGTEATDLIAQVSGTILMSEPTRGLLFMSLPENTESIHPRPSSDSSVHSLAGPHASGHVALIERDFLAKTYALKTLKFANGESSTVFKAQRAQPGDHDVGDELALGPHGQQVALVAHGEPVQLLSPHAHYREGTLEVWNLKTRRRTHSQPGALDDSLAWFPDGNRIAYVALIDPAQAENLRQKYVGYGDPFGVRTRSWSRVPVVHILNLETGESVALHRGQRPVLSPDGQTLLVRDFEMNWRVVELALDASHPFKAPGALHPGAIAFVSPHIVLYWARPTVGAPIVYAEHSGPWGGNRQLWTLKLVDLRDGRFQTVVPAIDSRREVSFGYGI